MQRRDKGETAQYRGDNRERRAGEAGKGGNAWLHLELAPGARSACPSRCSDLITTALWSLGAALRVAPNSGTARLTSGPHHVTGARPTLNTISTDSDEIPRRFFSFSKFLIPLWILSVTSAVFFGKQKHWLNGEDMFMFCVTRTLWETLRRETAVDFI